MPTGGGGNYGNGSHSGGRGGSGGGYGSSSSGTRSVRIDPEAVTPERPRYRKCSDRSPAYYRRSSRTGSTPAPNNGALLPTSSTLAGGGEDSGGGAGISTRVQTSPGASGSGGTGEGGVRVAVRVRPLSDEEEARGGERTIRCCNPKALEFFGTPITPGSLAPGSGGAGVGGDEARSYNFDLCAHEGFNQREMFSSCGLIPLLKAAVDGYAGRRIVSGSVGAVSYDLGA